MALIVCPECQNQMSDTALACPRCGWARAAIQSAEESRRAAANAAAAKAAEHAAGAKLVNISTWLLALAGLLIVSGCGITIGLQAGPAPAVGGIVIGFVVLVGSAVVGQIGRAKQGRII